jgi:hypothetical protein
VITQKPTLLVSIRNGEPIDAILVFVSVLGGRAEEFWLFIPEQYATPVLAVNKENTIGERGIGSHVLGTIVF